MNASVSPIFQDWLHTSARVFGDIPNYPPPKIDFPHPTTTTNCLIAIHIPQIVIPQQHGNCEASIHFWQNITDDSSDNHTEILNAVNSQYSQLFPRMRIHPRINPPSAWISQFFIKAQSRPPLQRVMVHYYSNGPPPQSDIQSIKGLFSDPKSVQCTAFVFEYDRCGQLLELFKSNPNIDSYAFFACDSNQILPRSSELPIDLFTSCMTTPARMALLWHSRHYYCFKNGPLKPLTPFFLEEDDNDCPISDIFNNVQAVMRHTVEAMAFETMDRATFIRLFRTDHVIAQLSVNFVFACHLFTFFNVTPVSFPSFPQSLANHHLWHTFDLRLDAELFRFQQPLLPQSVSFTRYLEQVVTSLKTAVEVSPKESDFLPQLSYISSMITMQSPPELVNAACEALAAFLDRNAHSVRSALHFPIIHSLLPLLLSMKGINENDCSQALIFCLCKILAYEPIGREQIFDRTPDFFMSIIFPLYPMQPSGLAVMKMYQQQQQQQQQLLAQQMYQKQLKMQQMSQQQKLLLQQQQQMGQQQLNQQQKLMMQQQIMQQQLRQQQLKMQQTNQQKQAMQQQMNQQQTQPQQMNQQQTQQPQMTQPQQTQQPQINQQQTQQQQMAQQQTQQPQMNQQQMQQQQAQQMQISQQQQMNQQQTQQSQIVQQQIQQPQMMQQMNQQQLQQMQMMQQQQSQIQQKQLNQQQQSQMQQQQMLMQQQLLQLQQQRNQSKSASPTPSSSQSRNQSATLPLILTVLFVRNSPKILNAFVNSPWPNFVVPLLKSKSVDTRIWSLLLISLAVKGIKDDKLLTSLFKEVKSLSDEGSTELRVALVYCLTQFVIDFRMPYQGEILAFILSNRSQPCYLIRCQVLSALSYYYQKFPEKFISVNSMDGEQEQETESDSNSRKLSQLDLLSHQSLLELSFDAHPLVAETATSIISSITNGDTDNIAKPSNLLDSFCSLILFPIGHVLASNKSSSIDRPMSIFAASKRPKVAPPAYFNLGGSGVIGSSLLLQGKSRRLQNMLKIGPIYNHPTQVTSNFVYLPPKQLLFGDKKGVINIKNWNDGKVAQSHKISDSELVCMKYVENSSFPLLFCSTTHGSCLCHSFAYKEPIKLLSAFQFHSSNQEPRHFFDVDAVYGRLFSYEPHHSDSLTLFDLRSEIEMPDVKFVGKTISSFHCVNQGTSIVAVCTNDNVFNLVDVRIKETVISVNLAARPFDFRVIDPTDPSFAVLLDGGVVEFFDLKNIEGSRRSSRIVSQPPVEVASYDANADTLFAAIGHSNGLSLVDLINQRVNPFNSQGWFGGGQTFGRISRTLFSPQDLSLSILSGKSEIAVLLEGKESE